MKKLKYLAVVALLMMLGSLFTQPAAAQNEVLTNIKTAIKGGSSKDLSRYFNSTVELGMEGNKSNYSQTQAEFILRDFFSRNPSTGFDYIHRGASREGLQYAIGKYNHNNGSYRVVIYVKQFKGNYLIDMIEFARE